MTSTKKTREGQNSSLLENQLEVMKIYNTVSNKEHLLLQEAGLSSPPGGRRGGLSQCA